MENKMYYNDKFDISRKLIDYYMEIEEFKYDLNKKQSVIDEKIISILQQREVEEYNGDYCYVKLKIEENKKINYSKYIEQLIEHEYKNLLDIIEGKKLLDYMIENEKAMNLYKKYRDEKNENDKLELIDDFKNNKRFDLLKFNLDDIKKTYEEESSHKKKEYLESIIEDNQKKTLIYDYIK